MRDFIYSAAPARILFGTGTVGRLGEELDRLGVRRALMLSTRGQQGTALAIAEKIGARCAGLFPGAAMHTPVDVTASAMEKLEETGADGLVAIGGGSAIGLSKAIALRTDLPQIVIPTTYAGSEMTPILGETQDGVKNTRSSPAILPEVVLYDVDLTLGLPAAISGVSGLNAIAHAVEALYARDRNPVTDLMAEQGVRALARSLPRIAANPGAHDARYDALYGAWLCGACLGSVGMALHHKICHTLGGSFGLPHAQTHAVMLPHALAYNSPAVPDAMATLGRAFASDDPAQALFDLGRDIGAPTALRDLGMARNDLDRAVDLVFANPYWNPRPLEPEAIRAMLLRAWAGTPPATI